MRVLVRKSCAGTRLVGVLLRGLPTGGKRSINNA